MHQAPYLREWIAFHQLFGVSKFFIYNQNNSTQYKNYVSFLLLIIQLFTFLLQSYFFDEANISDFIEQGVATVTQWHFWMKPELRHQAASFWHCLRNNMDVKWLAFFDVDEFLFTLPPPGGGPPPSLPEFLRPYEKYGALLVDRY